MLSKTKILLKIMILIIITPIFLISSVILVDSIIHKDKVPSFFGWKPFIVLSGSMETEIYAGDLAVVKQCNTNNLKVGDIIAFKEKDNIVITHRIVEIKNENGVIKYITKGDHNNTEDYGYVLPEQIEGIYKFRIARLGNTAMFLQTPLGIIVALSIPVIILILVFFFDSKENRKYINEKIGKENEMKKEIERLKKENEELAKK